MQYILLYEEDLKPEHRSISTDLIELEHFEEEVQKVVRVIGAALFYRKRGVKDANHKWIYVSSVHLVG